MVLSTARRLRPRAVLNTSGTVSSNTDRPRPMNNIFIFFLSIKARSEWSGSCWLVRTVIVLLYVHHKTANQDIQLACSYVFNFFVFAYQLGKKHLQTFKSYCFFFKLCFPLVGLKSSFAHLPSQRHRPFADFLFVTYRTVTFCVNFICVLTGIIKLAFTVVASV